MGRGDSPTAFVSACSSQCAQASSRRPQAEEAQEAAQVSHPERLRSRKEAGSGEVATASRPQHLPSQGQEGQGETEFVQPRCRSCRRKRKFEAWYTRRGSCQGKAARWRWGWEEEERQRWEVVVLGYT